MDIEADGNKTMSEVDNQAYEGVPKYSVLWQENHICLINFKSCCVPLERKWLSKWKTWASAGCGC